MPASIGVAAWVIGMRAMIKALLPRCWSRRKSSRPGASRRFHRAVSMIEEIKTLPLGAVWDYYC